MSDQLDPDAPPGVDSAVDIAAVAALREALWARGWRPVPIHSWDHPDVIKAGKAPLSPRWQLGAQQDPPSCVALGAVPWGVNTGIWMGGLRGVDIDVDIPAVVEAIVAAADQHLGAAGYLRRCRANSPRTLLLYQAAEPLAKKKTVVGAGGAKVEILGHGQQALCYGRHPSGAGDGVAGRRAARDRPGRCSSNYTRARSTPS